MKRTAAKNLSGTSNNDANALTSSLLGIEEGLVSGEFTPKEGIDEILATICDLDAVSGAVIALPNHRSFKVFVSAGNGTEPGSEIDSASQLYSYCLNEARMVLCEDGRHDERLSSADRTAIGSAMLMPLRAAGSVMGVLGVFSAAPGGLSRQYILPFSTAASLIEVLLGRVEQKTVEIPQGDDVRSMVPMPTHTSRSEGAKVVEMERPDDEASVGIDSMVGRRQRRGAKPEVQDRATAGSATPGSVPDRRVEDDIRAVLRASSRKQAECAGQTANAARGMSSAKRWAIAGGLLLCAALIGTVMILLGSETPAKASVDTRPQIPSLIQFNFGNPVLSKPAGGHNYARITSGRVITKNRPEYPVDALEQHVQGDVDAMLLIDDRGIVYDLKILSGKPSLANAVMASFSHWRFAPFTANGDNVGVNLPVHVSFTIDKTASKK